MALGATEPLLGTFALQGGWPDSDGYLTASASPDNPLATLLTIWYTRRDSHTPITSYRVDMTKRLHLIAVSDDFQTFLHVHPKLLPSGKFILAQTFPRRSLYHLYADAEPQGMRHQVFRFDLPVGSTRQSGLRDLNERRMAAEAGPYTISL